jgi:hypothetical protein
VIEVETVTKGADVSYEAVVERGGKKLEVMVDGTGKPMS